MKRLSNKSTQQTSVPELRMPQKWWKSMAVMHMLLINRTPCTAKNIAENTGYSRHSVSNMLLSMQEHGLVDSDMVNARLFFYGLTDKGYQLLNAFDQAVRNEEDAQRYYSFHVCQVDEA